MISSNFLKFNGFGRRLGVCARSIPLSVGWSQKDGRVSARDLPIAFTNVVVVLKLVALDGSVGVCMSQSRIDAFKEMLQQQPDEVMIWYGLATEYSKLESW